MSKLERLVAWIPDTPSFVKDVSEAPIEYPKDVWRTVRQHVNDQMLDIETSSKLSNSEKFRVFIGKFLYVQIRSETAERVMEHLRSSFNTPNELATANADSLVTKFRQLGYRFPDKARTLIEISKILVDRFDDKIDEYIVFADRNYYNDLILQVKGVGFKTRDIALSSFTAKYSLVDVHIANVLSRTGLVMRAYLYRLKLTTDRNDENNYLEMTKLLRELAEEAKMMPFEFDQTLWFFGKDYCSPMNCDKCPVKKCVTKGFEVQDF